MIALLLFSFSSVRGEELTVNVTTEGPRKGVIDILIFINEEGFPNKPDKAFRRARFPVTVDDPVTCVVTNLPYGTYSLSLLHDINDNYKADKMLGFGPPKEPVGFSNIDKKLRKQPSFESTLITFSARTNQVNTAVFYVL